MLTNSRRASSRWARGRGRGQWADQLASSSDPIPPVESSEVACWPRSRRISWRACVASAISAVMIVAAAPAAWAAPDLPANSGCSANAVLVKLGVVEDRAAANMLAEALRGLSISGRCLLDVEDAVPGVASAATRRGVESARHVYVVGGPAAIPDSWLRSTLGISDYVRVAGGNRWDTQAAVAAAIIAVATDAEVRGYDGAPSSSPVLPPNTSCDEAAVIVKLGVVEDRAAANMLVETLRALSILGLSRCLIDAGDPSAGIAPSATQVASARQAAEIYVVGGRAAIPDAWLARHFDISTPERIAGVDRWETQGYAAALIVSLATARRPAVHDAEPDEGLDGIG